MELIHQLQGSLELIVKFLEVLLEAATAICIVLGLLVSIKLAFILRRSRSTRQFSLGAIAANFWAMVGVSSGIPIVGRYLRHDGGPYV